MDAQASISVWIEQLKEGQQEAAAPLWQRYFHALVRLAQKKLHGTRRAAADEEDVALSAFDSFCRAAEAGRFPRLNDRDDLWRLLVVITERKAANQKRDAHRLKRGGGKVAGESAFASPDGSEVGPGIARVAGREPTPAFAAQVAEECQRLLEALGDDTLRRIAVLKMEGYANEEIAAQMTLALRTIERKLALIRKMWDR